MAIKIDSDSLMERAAKDVAGMFFGQATKDDEAKVSANRLSAEYLQEFEQTAELMADLEPLANDPLICSVVGQNKSVRRSSWPILGVAATLLMGVALVLWEQLATTAPEESNVMRYVTRIGEQKAVSLADGSVITMNTGTQLIVDISDDVREVILERGEAWFDVASDPVRPFMVSLGNRAVSVLGTKFNIFKTPDKFILAVLSGEVAIHGREDDLSTGARNLTVPKGEVLRLPDTGQHRVKAGIVAELDERNRELIAYAPENISRAQSWRSGVLRFDEVPLYQVIQELNRYSAKKILIEDKSVMDLRVFATIRVGGSPGMAMTALERLLPIRVVQHFDRIVIVGEGNDSALSVQNSKPKTQNPKKRGVKK